MVDLTSKAARELSKRGAAKGGQARASVLTPDERREIARKAVQARWAKAGKNADQGGASKADGGSPGNGKGAGVAADIGPELPFSIFRGTLKIGNMEIECHVLSDERRVFTQREVVRVLSGGRESGNLSRYLDRNPLYTNQFDSGPTVDFRIPGSPVIAKGYEATLLVEVCELYLEARHQKKLKASQMKLAVQAEAILRSCAKVGIIALIDEATGYQEHRKKRALQIKFQAFIAEELQEWALMFPQEFWFELARLEGVHYSPRNRPLRWGRYIMAFVYDAIDKDIGKRLREINPDPHYKQNHHQWLKEFGRQRVNDHLQRVIAVMKLCHSMDDFRKKFERVFSKGPLQEEFSFMEDGEA